MVQRCSPKNNHLHLIIQHHHNHPSTFFSITRKQSLDDQNTISITTHKIITCTLEVEYVQLTHAPNKNTQLTHSVRDTTTRNIIILLTSLHCLVCTNTPVISFPLDRLSNKVGDTPFQINLKQEDGRIQRI